MSGDDGVQELVKSTQRERAQLVAQRERLTKRASKVRAQLTQLEAQRAQLAERIQEIDEAFAPLKSLLGKRTAPKPAPVAVVKRHSVGAAMNTVVRTIGSHGLDPFTVSEIVQESGLTRTTVYSLLSQLSMADRIHRISLGTYRVKRAAIA